MSVRSELGAQANKLLRPLKVQIVPGTSPDPAVKAYIPAKKTIAAARSAGLSVSEYIEKIHVRPGASRAVVQQMLQVAGLSGTCETVREIGAGSGRFAVEVVAELHPHRYEIYETARDWLPELRKLPNAVILDCDGHTLGPTPTASVDLVHAQKVFSYIPFYAAVGYMAEMARVVRPGGAVAFDVVTEDCLEGPMVSDWIRNGSIHHPVPRDWLLAYLGERGLGLTGSFYTPLPPGKSEVLVFHRRG